MIGIIRFMVILLAFTVTTDILGSVPANGTLAATQACEAYVSKNKRTNPDNAKLTIGQSYAVIEVNKADNPSWYRLNVPRANPQERWVAENCGEINVQIGSGGNGSLNVCNMPGLEDSYILALSWQPSFCETPRGRIKPECQIDDTSSYQANNFTLHGLWPNKRDCGTKYEFCGEVSNKPDDFCDYPILSLFTEVRSNLEQVMPSAAAGSCLQYHQWFKHGTCQTKWSIDEYFDLAIDLTRQFNASGIGYFMSRNIGETITEVELIKRIDYVHGAGAHKSIELKCKNGNLVDVYIYLADDIDHKGDLRDLLRSDDHEFKSNCGGQFKVNPIGFAD